MNDILLFTLKTVELFADRRLTFEPNKARLILDYEQGANVRGTVQISVANVS